MSEVTLYPGRDVVRAGVFTEERILFKGRIITYCVYSFQAPESPLCRRLNPLDCRRLFRRVVPCMGVPPSLQRYLLTTISRGETESMKLRSQMHLDKKAKSPLFNSRSPLYKYKINRYRKRSRFPVTAGNAVL